MKLRLLAGLALLVGMGITCIPVFAHHGSTAYDTSKVVVLKGATVTNSCGLIHTPLSVST